MELTPDMMAHNKRSVIKWVEKHTEHYRSTGIKFENALDWVTQTRYEKSASEISTALGLGGSVRHHCVLCSHGLGSICGAEGADESRLPQTNGPCWCTQATALRKLAFEDFVSLA